MKQGDTVLLDGVKEVELKWKGGSLALIKEEDEQDSHGVDLRRLSEKGQIAPEVIEQESSTDLF